MTRQLAIMSWTACFFSVKPATMQPMKGGTSAVMILAKKRREARPKGSWTG
jgi:hypothetical protein